MDREARIGRHGSGGTAARDTAAGPVCRRCFRSIAMREGRVWASRPGRSCARQLRCYGQYEVLIDGADVRLPSRPGQPWKGQWRRECAASMDSSRVPIWLLHGQPWCPGERTWSSDVPRCDGSMRADAPDRPCLSIRRPLRGPEVRPMPVPDPGAGRAAQRVPVRAKWIRCAA